MPTVVESVCIGHCYHMLLYCSENGSIDNHKYISLSVCVWEVVEMQGIKKQYNKVTQVSPPSHSMPY